MGLLLAILLAVAGVQDPSQPGTAVIEGVVTRAGSSQPIADALVVIVGDKGPFFETRTDANGHYAVSNVPAGVFNMNVHADGFLAVPNSSTSGSARLTVSDEQRFRRNVVLAAASSISGRILDDNREPLPGITVEVLRLTRDLSGRGQWQIVESTETNDKGEYRVEGLPPEDYFVRASRKPAVTMTYFPGTLDARTAATIALRDGDESRAEFPLVAGRTYAIAGIIKNADSSPVQPVMLFAIPQDSKTPLDHLTTAGTSVDKDFELKGLLPGPYDLVAVSFASHKLIPTIELHDGEERVFSTERINIPMRVGKAFVAVRDADVRDIPLVLETGGDVSGRIKIAGNEAKPVELNASRGLKLPLDLSTDAASVQVRLGLQRRGDFLSGIAFAGLIQAGGDSFKFTDVAPGTYDVLVMPQEDSRLYVADVRALGRSVLDDGLQVSQRPLDSVEVLIGFDGGGVEGKVDSKKTSPVLVVLAPPPSRRKSTVLYKTMVLDDPSKPVSFSAVAPGLYSLFAFEMESKDEVVPYLDPDFLSLHQNRSVSISVEKGAMVSPAPLSLISR